MNEGSAINDYLIVKPMSSYSNPKAFEYNTSFDSRGTYLELTNKIWQNNFDFSFTPKHLEKYCLLGPTRILINTFYE